MDSKKLPSISVLIPTLNAASVLEKCLSSITNQDYPKEKIEIIIADGGSTDNTLSIVRKFQIPCFAGRQANSKLQIKIFPNPLKTGEAGKAVALRQARGELAALIDSDNILPERDWLKKMVKPFSDPEILGSEPWEFTYRKQDGFIDRYCALLGMNDPLCLFIGNYDKKNVLTGRWTDLLVEQEDKGEWLRTILRPGAIPTVGANGTILRRAVFIRNKTEIPGVSIENHLRGERRGTGDYLFDIDVIVGLASKKPVKFAKVKTGIIHLYCGSDIKKFIRKQKRRVRDYLYYQKIGVRQYPWQKQNKIGLLKFILACVTGVPLIYQVLKGYFKKRDLAWFFHPLACWVTLWVYGWGRLEGFLKVGELSREKWKQ